MKSIQVKCKLKRKLYIKLERDSVIENLKVPRLKIREEGRDIA